MKELIVNIGQATAIYDLIMNVAPLNASTVLKIKLDSDGNIRIKFETKDGVLIHAYTFNTKEVQ